ncbi:MAG: DUF5060 domain-containing protein [Candidatus Marinimicrobia bacterium]|nr:DUF5060 domain-containing protein [Candidatus Neomarinimicrobiota bacterium]
MRHFLLMLVLGLAAGLGTAEQTTAGEISGELQTWHKVTITFTGPETSEQADPNPFTDYRLNVTFTNGNTVYRVPGYYAADGNAANSSADSGNKWQVHFSPDKTGMWKYEVSFRKGTNIAVDDDPKAGSSAGYMDGSEGSFTVEETDKTGRDFRARGRLQYVGEHYLKSARSGEYFLKCGADAPENFLAYYEIDHTPDVGDRLKRWEDHAQDYNDDANEYLWGPNQQQGKNILGSINYLSEKGMNVFSFLTFNVDGDDRNVFPHLLKVSLDDYEKASNDNDDRNQWEEMVIHDRFDVSKLAQWERIFSYGQMKGMFLHFKTQETENDQKMDGGAVGPERKLYYRELIARFGHHLALNWNLGEENTQTIQQLREATEYFAQNDPYKHLVVVHTYPDQHEKYYGALKGDQSELTGLSIQTNRPDFSRVHEVVKKWVKESADTGKKWVVACDEPGDAQHALLPDAENPDHDNARMNGLWGTFMAGGCGTEWYFGYQHAHSDLTCESWRSRDLFWDQGKIALDFFNDNNIPVHEMHSMDEITETENDYVFAKNGELYLVYMKSGGENRIDLGNHNSAFQVHWFNPRSGGELQRGSVNSISGPGLQELGTPPATPEKDWLVVIRRAQ